MDESDNFRSGLPSSVTGLRFPLVGGDAVTVRATGDLFASSPSYSMAGATGWTPLTIDLGGHEITVSVSPANKPLVKQRLKELIRKEKRRAANAANAANTAQQIGIGIGGALAVGGGVALVTLAAPLVFGAAIVTGAGAVIAIAGLGASHWMNSKKFERDEKIDRFADALEELK